MKAYALLVAAVLVIAFISGCVSQEKKETTTQKEITSQTEQPLQELKDEEIDQMLLQEDQEVEIGEMI